jgi:hypothetical protein
MAFTLDMAAPAVSLLAKRIAKIVPYRDPLHRIRLESGLIHVMWMFDVDKSAKNPPWQP